MRVPQLSVFLSIALAFRTEVIITCFHSKIIREFSLASKFCLPDYVFILSENGAVRRWETKNKFCGYDLNLC